MCVCLQATTSAENSWSHGCCHQDWGTMGWPSKPLVHQEFSCYHPKVSQARQSRGAPWPCGFASPCP